MTKNIIYIGDNFYFASGTIMSCLYSETGQRFDWGMLEHEMRMGTTVTIRPATAEEQSQYDEKLSAIQKAR